MQRISNDDDSIVFYPAPKKIIYAKCKNCKKKIKKEIIEIYCNHDIRNMYTK